MIPLIVLTGQTACGKSALALKLAQRWGGEIICADSRTIYKGMDIGTAKPSKAERRLVRHWGLDLVEPGERFTAHDFQQMAYGAMADIRRRGKVPFLVGGTGLYVDAVVLNFVFGSDVDISRRAALEKLSIEQLITLCQKQHIVVPENFKNKRYLIRSVEKNNILTSGNTQPQADTYVFAIQLDKTVLQERIAARVDDMFTQNIVLETQQLLDEYGADSEAMTGNIYRIILQYLKGDIDEQTAKEMCATRDWQLAKRQLTWLRRHKYVQWVVPGEAEAAIETVLRKYRDV